MLSSSDYTSLESACTAIKARDPALLGQFSVQVLEAFEPGQEFNSRIVCVVENGEPKRSTVLTYEDIGNYLFKAATGKHVPVFLQAESGTVESSRVFVSRNWISTNLIRAAEHLKVDATIQQPAANLQLAVTKVAVAGRASVWVDQPPKMSADGHKQLRRWIGHQNDQRKAYESASKLAIQLQAAIERAERAETISQAKSAEVVVLQSRDRLSMMELSSKERTIQSQRLEIQKLTERLGSLTTGEPGPKPQHAKERAKAAVHRMAMEMWASPDFEHYRVGDMADFIKIHMLAHSEHRQAMPELTSTVVKWLKEMGGIPAKASLPGRTPKPKK